MSTTLTKGRRIDIPSVPNLRDLGGYTVAGGGKVRTPIRMAGRRPQSLAETSTASRQPSGTFVECSRLPACSRLSGPADGGNPQGSFLPRHAVRSGRLRLPPRP